MADSGAPTNADGATVVTVIAPVAATSPHAAVAMLYGNGAPTSDIGLEGSFYRNMLNDDLYGPKENGVWPDSYSIRGTKGDQGDVGPAGVLAQDDRDFVTAAQTAASASAAAASLSQAAAKLNETNSKTSEGNSKTSETNSKVSEANSKTSENNTAVSAAAAATAAATATSAANTAGASAGTASAAADAANTSQQAAAAAAAVATANATAALTSRNNASTSETNTAAAATAATAAAAAASTSKDAAATSETNAAASKNAAAASAAQALALGTDLAGQAAQIALTTLQPKVDLAVSSAADALASKQAAAAAADTSTQNAAATNAAAAAAQTSAAAASGSATTATQQATTAQQQAAAAAASATTASQQAAIGAAANRVYASTALGVAATTDGQYFYVPSTSAQGAFDLWLNKASVATATGITLPNQAAVQATAAAVKDVANRTSTVRYLPLTSGLDVDFGICVDGAFRFWVDSAGVFHSNHDHDGLSDIPWMRTSVKQMQGTAVKRLPLANGYDVDFGVLVDGAYRYWIDSTGVFHSTHSHDGLSDIPSLKKTVSSIAPVAPRVLPIVNGYDVDWGISIDGAFTVWVDSAGVFHSKHTHDGLSDIPAIKASVTAMVGQSAKKLPLSNGNDVEWGISVDGKYIISIDSAGVFHSTHTHTEFTQLATLATQVAAVQAQLNSGALGGNASGYLVEQVAVANGSVTEQQLMVLDGTSQYRQLTKTGYNWRAPVVHHNTAVRCITDYFFANGNDAVTLLATGEIVPEAGMLVHYPVYGQSLALGARGFVSWTGDATNGFTAATVFTSAASVHADLCLAFGDGTVGYPRTGTVFNKFGVIREQWPAATVVGETVCSSFANSRNDRLLRLWGVRQRILATSTGLGATPYSGLQKGTSPYNSLISSVKGGMSTAAAKGWKYMVPVLYIIHGESETGNIADTTYAGYLLQWLTDFTADIMPVTGQRNAPSMILSQMNRQKSSNEGVTLGQILAHDNNANIVLIGPKYQHTYYDDAHMLAEGYVKQGEYGERASRHLMAGRKWQPLRPLTVVGSGSTVTVKFNNTLTGDDMVAGPLGALALDTTVVADPGKYGFECTDTSVTVTNVALGADGTSVVITLSGTPASGSSIQYAMQSSLNLNTMPTGQNMGSRGCLRDSDTRDQSRFDATNLYNWCVAFRKTIS